LPQVNPNKRGSKQLKKAGSNLTSDDRRSQKGRTNITSPAETEPNENKQLLTENYSQEEGIDFNFERAELSPKDSIPERLSNQYTVQSGGGGGAGGEDLNPYGEENQETPFHAGERRGTGTYSNQNRSNSATNPHTISNTYNYLKDDPLPDIDEEELLANQSHPINFGAKRKGMLPKFAHILSHTKSMMARSFDRKVNDENGSTERDSHFVSEKHFYYDVLKELEQIPLDLESDSQVAVVLSKADKEDQTAY